MPGENFFDFREKITAKPKPYGAEKDPASALTVTQITAKIESTIKAGLPGSQLVRGEVTNFSRHRQSGHLYFTMKDAGACIDCVMFRSSAEKLKFDPQDGMELLASGSIAIYAQRGKYQLYVTSLQPIGQGALELAFQQLRAKLEAQGLFDAVRKRRLPKYPTRLILITSRETAALADMLKVLHRYPWIKLYLYHTPVQGAAAAPAIAAALDHLGRTLHTIGGADAILLGRGGGSLEDLWAFNEEAVARAIANTTIPVITGIGHEVDVSIADLVADYHAHTPTEAARVAMTNWEKVLTDLATSRTRLDQAARSIVQHAQQRLVSIERQELFRRPLDRVHRLQQRIDDRERALQNAAAARLRMFRRRLDTIAQRLERHRPSTVVAQWRATMANKESRLRVAEQRRARTLADRLTAAQGRLARLHPQSRINVHRLRLDALFVRLHRGEKTLLDRRRQTLLGTENRLRISQQRRLKQLADRLNQDTAQLARSHPSTMINFARLRIDGLLQRLNRGAQTDLDRRRQALSSLEKHLRAVGPDQVLARGYTITLTADGKVIRTPTDVAPGDEMITRLAAGEIRSTVDGDRQRKLFD